jgi:hypothetical protein
MDDHGPGFCKKCLQLQRPCENYPVGKITEQSTRKRKVIEKPIKTKSAPKREEENITETQTKRNSAGVLPSKEKQSNEVLGRNEDDSDRRSEQRKDKSGRRGNDNASNGGIHSKLADGNKSRRSKFKELQKQSNLGSSTDRKSKDSESKKNTTSKKRLNGTRRTTRSGEVTVTTSVQDDGELKGWVPSDKEVFCSGAVHNDKVRREQQVVWNKINNKIKEGGSVFILSHPIQAYQDVYVKYPYLKNSKIWYEGNNFSGETKLEPGFHLGFVNSGRVINKLRNDGNLVVVARINERFVKKATARLEYPERKAALRRYDVIKAIQACHLADGIVDIGCQAFKVVSEQDVHDVETPVVEESGPIASETTQSDQTEGSSNIAETGQASEAGVVASE